MSPIFPAMTPPHAMPEPNPEKSEDTTWVVLLIIFGLAGLGGPLLFILLFWLL